MAKAVYGLTNKEFRAKFKTKSRRSNNFTKLSRRKWWKSLSSDEQAAYVSKKIQEKSNKRRKYEETYWKEAIIGDRRKYCCKTCFHLKVKCCEGLSTLSKICKHFYQPKVA